jgi:hypothetical protein
MIFGVRNWSYSEITLRTGWKKSPCIKPTDTGRKRHMRQKFKGSSDIKRPVKWLIPLLLVAVTSGYFLSESEFIQAKVIKDNTGKLDKLMFWKQLGQPPEKTTAAGLGKDKAPEAAQKAGSTAAPPATQAASAQTAPPPAQLAPPQSPTASPPAQTASGPAQTPAAKPAADAAAGGKKLLAQAQSIVTVSTNEQLWLDLTSTIRFEKGKLFSYNAWINEMVKTKRQETKENELQHIAGLVYEAAVRGGLMIAERHTHLTIPDYAASGFDVDYQPNSKDLVIYNPYDFEMTVGVAGSGSTPILTLSGTPSSSWKAPKITVAKESFTQEKAIVTDYAMGGGEARRSEGAPGLLVKVYTDAKLDGKNELVTKDFYAPSPVIIARAPSSEELKAAAGGK